MYECFFVSVASLSLSRAATRVGVPQRVRVRAFAYDKIQKKLGAVVVVVMRVKFKPPRVRVWEADSFCISADELERSSRKNHRRSRNIAMHLSGCRISFRCARTRIKFREIIQFINSRAHTLMDDI